MWTERRTVTVVEGLAILCGIVEIGEQWAKGEGSNTETI